MLHIGLMWSNIRYKLLDGPTCTDQCGATLGDDTQESAGRIDIIKLMQTNAAYACRHC